MIGFGGTGSPKLCMQPEMIPQKFYLKRLFLSSARACTGSVSRRIFSPDGFMSRFPGSSVTVQGAAACVPCTLYPCAV